MSDPKDMTVAEIKTLAKRQVDKPIWPARCDETAVERYAEGRIADLEDALQETARRLEVMDWQPIETAPKDGSKILLHTPNGIGVGWWGHEDGLCGSGQAFIYAGWHTESFETHPGTNLYGGTEEDAVNPPTHWQPLPEPPHPKNFSHKKRKNDD